MRPFLIALAFASTTLAAGLSAEPAAAQADDPAVRAAIAAELGDRTATTRTTVRFAGEGEGRIALAYLIGPDTCGTGGCNLLILRHGQGGWESVGNVARVRPPVRLLTTSSHGLPDLGVTVSGGGGPAAYEARLSFDGRSYPRFPSDTPLAQAEGTVVLSETDASPTP